jgi:hypothetical protein
LSPPFNYERRKRGDLNRIRSRHECKSSDLDNNYKGKSKSPRDREHNLNPVKNSSYGSDKNRSSLGIRGTSPHSSSSSSSSSSVDYDDLSPYITPENSPVSTIISETFSDTESSGDVYFFF